MHHSYRLCFLGSFVITALFGVSGCQGPAKSDNPVIAWVSKLLGDSAETRRQKLLDKLSSPDADLRREGVLMLGEGESATWQVTCKILSIMATGDPDAFVRSAAVEVLAENYLARQSDPDETVELISQDSIDEVLQSAAKDQSSLVRMETVLAVQKLPSPAGMRILLDRLSVDRDRAVRGEAAATLAHYHDARVVRALIIALDDEEFGVSFRARESLTELTGEDFGYDRSAWQRWFSGAGKGFTDAAAPDE